MATANRRTMAQRMERLEAVRYAALFRLRSLATRQVLAAARAVTRADVAISIARRMVRAEAKNP